MVNGATAPGAGSDPSRGEVALARTGGLLGAITPSTFLPHRARHPYDPAHRSRRRCRAPSTPKPRGIPRERSYRPGCRVRLARVSAPLRAARKWSLAWGAFTARLSRADACTLIARAAREPARPQPPTAHDRVPAAAIARAGARAQTPAAAAAPAWRPRAPNNSGVRPYSAGCTPAGCARARIATRCGGRCAVLLPARRTSRGCAIRCRAPCRPKDSARASGPAFCA